MRKIVFALQILALVALAPRTEAQSNPDIARSEWKSLEAKLSPENSECLNLGLRYYGTDIDSEAARGIRPDTNNKDLVRIGKRCDAFTKRQLRKDFPCWLERKADETQFETKCNEVYFAEGREVDRETALQIHMRWEAVDIRSEETEDARRERNAREAKLQLQKEEEEKRAQRESEAERKALIDAKRVDWELVGKGKTEVDSEWISYVVYKNKKIAPPIRTSGGRKGVLYSRIYDQDVLIDGFQSRETQTLYLADCDQLKTAPSRKKLISSKGKELKSLTYDLKWTRPVPDSAAGDALKTVCGRQLRAEKERLMAQKAEQERIAKERDRAFPYIAFITCGTQGQHINVLACFAGAHGGVDTELELRNGKQYGLYKVYDISNLGEESRKGLAIKLSRSFQLTAQNASDILVLGVRIVDRATGRTLFEKQVGMFGVIKVRN